MNRVILTGNLGMDPELRHTGTGNAILRLRLATNDRRKKDGEWVDHTEWHTVIVWGNRGEALNKILSKGSKVAIEGRLQTRSWEAKDGSGKRYATEIVAQDVELMGGKPSAGGGHAQPQWSGGEQAAFGGGGDFGEDDIPFKEYDERLA